MLPVQRRAGLRLSVRWKRVRWKQPIKQPETTQ